jgi:PAS domain S-box-containing protein
MGISQQKISIFSGLNAMNQGVCLINSVGEIIFHNDAFKSVTGLSDAEIKKMEEGLFALTETMVGNQIRGKIAENQSWEGLTSLNGALDEKIRLSMIPYFLPEEQEGLFLIVINRASEVEKELLENLEKKNRQYELAIKGTRNGLWDWNLETNEIYFSSQWFEMLGFSPDELPHSIDTFYDLLHPEDYFKVIREITGFVKLEIIHYDVEFRMRQKDGEFKWINARGDVLLNEQNKAYRFIGFNRDITERKLAEELVAAKEREYRSLINSLQEVIFKTDIYGAITFLNPHWEKMTGYVVENSIGEDLSLFLHPDEQYNRKLTFRNLITGQISMDIPQLKMVTREGKVIWVELQARPLINEETRMPEGAYGSIKDITDQRRAQIALEESELRQKEVLNSIEDAVWTYDVRRKEFSFFGHSMLQITGYNEEAFEKDPFFLFQIAHPEAKALARKAFQKLEDGAPDQEYVFRILHQTDGIRYIRLRSKRSGSQLKGTLRIDGTVVDITALKLAENAFLNQERAYRHLVNSLSEVVFRFDKGGKILFVNPAFEKLTGNESIRIGETAFFDLIYEDDLDTMLDAWQYLAKDLKEVVYVEVRIQHGAKSYRWVELTLQKSEKDYQIEYFGLLTDIHEKREANARLAESEKKYRFLSENLNDIIFLLDTLGGFEYISPSIKHLGYTSQELLQGNLTNLIHTDFQDHFKDCLKQVIRNKQKVIFEGLYVDAHGQNCEYETLMQPVLNKTGKVSQIQVSARDITERIQIRKALQESENRFKTIAESLPIPVVITDNKTLKVKYANQALLDHYQVDRNEVVQKPLLKLFKFKKDLKTYLERLESDGGLNAVEYQTVNNHGQVEWVSIYVRPIEYDGNPSHIMVLQNISDRKKAEELLKESEEKYRLISENISDLVCFHNTKGEIMYMSPSVSELLGYQPEEWIGKAPLNLLEIGHEKSYFGAIEPSLLLQKEKIRHRLQFKHKNGELLWFETVASPIFNADLELIGVQTVSRNVMSFVRAEEEMQKALEKERELNELKSRFVSMASHEFRTPLTAIRSSIELLGIYSEKVEPDLQQKLNKHFEKIIRETKRLTSLMNDILILGRAEAGKTPFLPEGTDVYQLCSEVLDMFQPQPDAPGLEFVFAAKTREFHLDPELMTHVLSNLVSNALKYSKGAKKPLLWVDMNSNYLTIKVQDYGIGIPKDEQEQLFQSFFRARNAINFQGTGLGLVIVKHVVDLHQGEISVKSELGEGSTFTIRLPKIKLS